MGVGYSKEEFIIPTSWSHQVNVVPLARTKQTRRKTKSELAEEKRLKEEEEKKKQEQELLDEEMKKKAKEKESRKTKPGNLFILVSEHCLVSETLKSVQLRLDQIGKAGAKRKQSEG